MKRLFLLFALSACAYAQVFPTAVAVDQDVLVAKDRSASTLNGAINSSTLSVVVASGAAFIAKEVITIESEQMQICSISTNTLTICTGTRGFGGTTAASHASLVAVRGQITASHHNKLANEIKAIEDALGINLENIFNAGTGSGKSGYLEFFGATSGGAGWSVADVAGTQILYLLPTTAGTAGQTLVDNGTTTCPTLAGGAPALCHQTIWSTPSGGGGGGATTQGVFASLPGTCTTGDLYLVTDSGFTVRCSATNTWSYFYTGLGKVTLPVIGNFTAVNGTGSATDATTGGLWVQSNAPGASVENYQLWTEAQPSRPYTVVACFVPSFDLDNYQQFGIFFRDSSTSKFVGYSAGIATGNVGTLNRRVTYFTNNTTAASNPKIVVLGLTSQSPLCLAAKDDGTSFTFYYGVEANLTDPTKWSAFSGPVSRTAHLATPDTTGFFIAGGAGKAQVRLVHYTH